MRPRERERMEHDLQPRDSGMMTGWPSLGNDPKIHGWKMTSLRISSVLQVPSVQSRACRLDESRSSIRNPRIRRASQSSEFSDFSGIRAMVSCTVMVLKTTPSTPKDWASDSVDSAKRGLWLLVRFSTTSRLPERRIMEPSCSSARTAFSSRAFGSTNDSQPPGAPSSPSRRSSPHLCPRRKPRSPLPAKVLSISTACAMMPASQLLTRGLAASACVLSMAWGWLCTTS